MRCKGTRTGQNNVDNKEVILSDNSLMITFYF